MYTNPWDDLRHELDRWSRIDRLATFWWRDDDAVAVTPALVRLLGLAGERDLPLAVAVIPASVETELADYLGIAANVCVVQHGYAHINHAPPGHGGWEQGLHRPLELVLDELARGCRRLGQIFGKQFAPALVPPWNRIDEHVLPHLPKAGLRAVSTFGPRPSAMAAVGVIRVNAHCDPVHWKAARRFRGTEPLLEALTSHLRDRRRAGMVTDEPTGLLTHHLDMDAQTWDFVAALLDVVTEHPATRWQSIVELTASTEHS